jgi:putative Ca2+/H+ antiporter (TMEM165/GDT1 family)
MFQHAIVTFVAVFLAELPDKTMFATLLLSTHFRRKFPVWIGVTIGYSFHVVIAVIFGSALSRLPERPIQLLVGALFIVGGVMTWRAGKDDDEESTDKWSTTMSNSRVAWTAASVILVAEFGDLTHRPLVFSHEARFEDEVFRRVTSNGKLGKGHNVAACVVRSGIHFSDSA